MLAPRPRCSSRHGRDLSAVAGKSSLRRTRDGGNGAAETGLPAATLCAPQSLSGSASLGRLAHDVATETKGLAGHVLSLDRGRRARGPPGAPARCPAVPWGLPRAVRSAPPGRGSSPPALHATVHPVAIVSQITASDLRSPICLNNATSAVASWNSNYDSGQTPWAPQRTPPRGLRGPVPGRALVASSEGATAWDGARRRFPSTSRRVSPLPGAIQAAPGIAWLGTAVALATDTTRTFTVEGSEAPTMFKRKQYRWSIGHL